MSEQGSSMLRYMANPRAFTLKRWFSELLKDRYPPHDTIIDRVSSALQTEKDVTDFGKLIGEVYEIAYKKAVADYQDQIEKLGVKVTIGPSGS